MDKSESLTLDEIIARVLPPSAGGGPPAPAVSPLPQSQGDMPAPPQPGEAQEENRVPAPASLPSAGGGPPAPAVLGAEPEGTPMGRRLAGLPGIGLLAGYAYSFLRLPSLLGDLRARVARSESSSPQFQNALDAQAAWMESEIVRIQTVVGSIQAEQARTHQQLDSQVAQTWREINELLHSKTSRVETERLRREVRGRLEDHEWRVDKALRQAAAPLPRASVRLTSRIPPQALWPLLEKELLESRSRTAYISPDASPAWGEFLSNLGFRLLASAGECSAACSFYCFSVQPTDSLDDLLPALKQAADGLTDGGIALVEIAPSASSLNVPHAIAALARLQGFRTGELHAFDPRTWQQVPLGGEGRPADAVVWIGRKG